MKRLVLQEENGPLMMWFAKVACLCTMFCFSIATLLLSIAAIIVVYRWHQ